MRANAHAIKFGNKPLDELMVDILGNDVVNSN